MKKMKSIATVLASAFSNNEWRQTVFKQLANMEFYELKISQITIFQEKQAILF